jgi:hypothetical protein
MRTRLRKIHDAIFPPDPASERLRLAIRDAFEEQGIRVSDVVRDERFDLHIISDPQFGTLYAMAFKPDPRSLQQVAKDIRDEAYPPITDPLEVPSRYDPRSRRA